ncbi:MAG: glycosyl hydrolase family protein [Ignavibacteriales bacterium]|nr:MAG: glycosyl hydrolase family protein [Ignavibacteriales bacterium]
MKKILLTTLFILMGSTFVLNAKNFKGAEYRTKAAYTYGRFEARIKSAQREGMLSSFFTYHDGSSTWNEIDIEIMGRYNDNVQFNTITPGQTNHVRAQNVNFNPAEDFHTYAFEWTPDYVAWFIDGEEVARQTEDHIKTLNRPQKIMMNIWNPAYENWAGIFNEITLPFFAYYDFVSYYSYTPGTGTYGTGNNFTHLWTDEFNSWDQTRWDKATHTFNGNNCDFVQENAVFRDGKLVLCLTDPDNLGFTDKKIPVLLTARATSGKVTATFSEELDKTTAENKSLYMIAGTVIDSIRLQGNLKKVDLFISKLDLSKSYNLITLAGINDLADPPNITSAKAVMINMPKQLSFPIKINVGGLASSGYLADQEWNESVEYGYLDGTAAETSALISGTDEDYIYKSERYSLVTYKVRVPNGAYKLKLMMSENYFTENDKRVFDIFVEDSLVADNVDIFKAAGKNAAYNLTIDNIIIKDEVIDIYFPAEINNPLVDGIVVEQVSTGLNEQDNLTPDKFILEQNYPNPFNGNTIIKFFVSKEQPLDFYIYDTLGRKIFSKRIEDPATGENYITWNSNDEKNLPVCSGVYFYTLAGNDFTMTKKLLLMK